MSRENFAGLLRICSVMCIVLAMSCLGLAQKDTGKAAKDDTTGHYEGTAKNNAGEVISVALDLSEKQGGAMSGTIRSSHGDFPITGGSRHGENVTLEFDANGAAGMISLKAKEDELAGTWSAGDDGGPVEVKRVAAQASGPKGKS